MLGANISEKNSKWIARFLDTIEKKTHSEDIDIFTLVFIADSCGIGVNSTISSGRVISYANGIVEASGQLDYFSVVEEVIASKSASSTPETIDMIKMTKIPRGKTTNPSTWKTCLGIPVIIMDQ